MDHQPDPESMGSRVAALRAGVLPVAAAACSIGALAIARSAAGGSGIEVAVTFGILAVGIASFWGVHRVRAAAARADGGFGSSSSQHVDDLRTVPRFAASVAEMRWLDGTKGWIGGGIEVGADGIRWAPSAFSRRFRRVPTMAVSWSEVHQVRTEALSGVGKPGGVYIDLDDGSTWTLNASPIDELRRVADVHAPQRR